jgi:hypothetical protein
MIMTRFRLHLNASIYLVLRFELPTKDQRRKANSDFDVESLQSRTTKAQCQLYSDCLAFPPYFSM